MCACVCVCVCVRVCTHAHHYAHTAPNTTTRDQVIGAAKPGGQGRQVGMLMLPFRNRLPGEMA